MDMEKSQDLKTPLVSSNEYSDNKPVDIDTWEGNQRFVRCCGSKKHIGVTGPESNQTSVIFVHGILILSQFLWLWFLHPFFVQELDRAGYSYTTIIMGIVTHILVIITEFSEPGAIKRGDRKELVQNLSQTKWFEKMYQNRDNQENISKIAHIYKPRYCLTCNIMRPELASHCHICDTCINKFDHHCTIINNCIGQRNMRIYVITIYLSYIYSLLSLIGSIIYMCCVFTNGVQEIGVYKKMIITFFLVSSLPFYYVIGKEFSHPLNKLYGLGLILLFQIPAFSIMLCPIKRITNDNNEGNWLFYGVSPFPGYLFTISTIWMATVWHLIIRYFWLVQRGYTLKEQVSILRAKEEMIGELSSQESALTCSQRLANVWSFMTYKIEPSIFDEQD